MRGTRIGTNHTAACQPKPRKSNRGPAPDREQREECNLAVASTRRSDMQHKLAENERRRREGGGEEGKRGKKVDMQTCRHAELCGVV